MVDCPVRAKSSRHHVPVQRGIVIARGRSSPRAPIVRGCCRPS